MSELERLASGKSLIYIFTRLFDFHEKLKAEWLERSVLKAVHDAFDKAGLQYEPTGRYTFVPFRDTAQDSIVSDDPAKIIYAEDLQRLGKTSILLGYYDGLGKDEGIGFEIGYAYAKGLPIVGIMTDFMRRAIRGQVGSTHRTDPVLLNMFTSTVEHHQVSSIGGSFEQRLRDSVEVVHTLLGDSITGLLMDYPTIVGVELVEPDTDVYLDFGGGQFEWERMVLSHLKNQLEQKGLAVRISQRYYPQEVGTLSNDGVLTIGMKDIKSALRSRVVVTCADMEEMSAGTAAIHGLARGVDKDLVLVDTRSTLLIGDGTHRSSRNLMIDQSASTIVRSYEGVLEAVLGYL